MRDYKKEYEEYHSSKTQKLRRAMRNKANRELNPGPGKEVDHKIPLSSGGSNSETNWRVVTRSTNRKKYNKTADLKEHLGVLIGAPVGSAVGYYYGDEPSILNTIAGTSLGAGFGMGVDLLRKEGLRYFLDRPAELASSKVLSTAGGAVGGLPGAAVGAIAGSTLGSKIDDKIRSNVSNGVKEASYMGPLTTFVKLSEKGVATKTNPEKWEAAKREAKAKMGGKHSARAMQLATQIYKKKGGGYSGGEPSAKSNKLKKWTKQDWQWSGERKKEAKSKGVYLPAKAIDAYKSSEKGKAKLKAAVEKKRKATAAGEQFANHGLHKGKKRSEVHS